jgi:hypothetical protein
MEETQYGIPSLTSHPISNPPLARNRRLEPEGIVLCDDNLT